MIKSYPKFIGWILIGLGLIILMDNYLDISLWAIVWPLAFISLGVWLLSRDKGKFNTTTQKIFGDVNRDGVWQVTNEEILLGIGDVNLDLTRADIPQGESKIRIMGLIGDIDFKLPQELGVWVTIQGLITDSKILGNHQEKFFSSTHEKSKNYTSTKKQIIIDIHLLIGDVSIQRADK